MTAEEAKEIMCKVTFYWELGEQTLTQNQINEALDMAIKALEQQPCEDCISREAVHEMLENIPINESDKWFNWLQKACLRLAELPSVQPTRPTGRWILLDECSNSGYYCSECHKKVIKEGWSNTVKKIKYCPNCGAKMEVEDEADN